jgi:hypothetical protein
VASVPHRDSFVVWYSPVTTGLPPHKMLAWFAPQLCCGIHEPTPVVSIPPDSNSPVLSSCNSTDWPLFRSSVFLLIYDLLWLSLHSCKLNCLDRVASFQSTLRSLLFFLFVLACHSAGRASASASWLPIFVVLPTGLSWPHCRSL